LVPATVIAQSSKSSFVFAPFKIRGFKLSDANGYSLNRVLPQLPPTALVMAAENIDLDAEPEEGPAGQLAKAMDAFRETERRSARSAKALERSRQQVEKLKSRLADLEKDQPEDARNGIEKELEKAEKDADTAFRKAAKASVRLEEAAQAVEKLGGLSPLEPEA
jgi:hypothetical protein